MELNPAGDGWIKKHFALMKDEHFSLSIKSPKGFDNEEIIFGSLVSTGLVYGIPISFLGIDNIYALKWTREEKLKISLYEALLSVYQTNVGVEQTNLEEFVETLLDFYDQLGIKKVRSMLKMITGQSSFDKVESILQKRASIDKKFNNKLWINYQTNSLVFTDVILYNDFLTTQISGEALQLRRKTIITSIIKVISAGLNTGLEHGLGANEVNIYKTYVASAGFIEPDDYLFEEGLNQPIPINEIKELEQITNWIEKRYVLETAILIMWSDQSIEDKELEFLLQLSLQLGLSQQDLENCLMFIETFVLENYEEIPFFSDDKAYAKIYGDLSSRFVKLLSRNKDKLAQEIIESKDLVQLISKSTHTDLNKEEKKRMRQQLMDIIKSIPALAIFLLPGGAVLLPIVLKIIPKLIPSAFRQNHIEEKEKD
jgi:hypothetical protein